MSWGSAVPVTRSPEDILFTIEIVALENGTLSEMIEINSDITDAESYSINAGGGELMGIALKFWQVPSSNAIELFQNEPNPFSGRTNIEWYLPNASAATLTVFDIRGVRVYEIEGTFDTGYHSISMGPNDLSGSGTYFYSLQTADSIVTKKMILLNTN
jgi:hypothetical protein